MVKIGCGNYHCIIPFSNEFLLLQQPVVRVGEWLVTPSINQISRNGRQLTLEPRLIDLLVFFAQHSGEVLSRDELIDNVWKRSIVTNHVVTQSISELRKSLKDNDEDSPVYIATVPKARL
ncbi:DNA-binding transcriptional activator CadC [Escherichia coli]|uniref:DNA-binding transcriptional activator CadC n=1 Tax=Escherichia coli TaxID=562 RepID=A0A376JSZ3_ECOLX|nr:DNA-binding transcriptional activator CadC [Escherichia coli]